MSVEPMKEGSTVLIPRFQTAKLWTIPNSKDATAHVVSFHCYTCSNPENSRLLHLELSTVRDRSSGNSSGKVRVLLQVTRSQIEEVLASFGRRDNATTLRVILTHKEWPAEFRKEP